MPPSPTERILNLAAFLNDRRRAGVTLDEIARSVPGYRDDADGTDLVPQSPEWEAVRRKVRRDFASLQDDWGITVTYVEERSTDSTTDSICSSSTSKPPMKPVMLVMSRRRSVRSRIGTLVSSPDSSTPSTRRGLGAC